MAAARLISERRSTYIAILGSFSNLLNTLKVGRRLLHYDVMAAHADLIQRTISIHY